MKSEERGALRAVRMRRSQSLDVGMILSRFNSHSGVNLNMELR